MNFYLYILIGIIFPNDKETFFPFSNWTFISFLFTPISIPFFTFLSFSILFYSFLFFSILSPFRSQSTIGFLPIFFSFENQHYHYTGCLKSRFLIKAVCTLGVIFIYCLVNQITYNFMQTRISVVYRP